MKLKKYQMNLKKKQKNLSIEKKISLFFCKQLKFDEYGVLE